MHEPTVMIAVLSDRRITRPCTKNLWLAPGARSSHDYPAAHYPLVALDLYELMDLQFALPSLCQAAVDLARKVLVREDIEVFHEVFVVASAHDNDIRPWVPARDEDGPAGRMDLLYIAAHRVSKRGKGY